MFKKLTTVSLAVAALACGGQAMAANYVGGNILASKYDEDRGGSADLVSLYGRLGTEFSENFSGELRLGTGIDDDNIGRTKIEQDLFYGAYVRGGIPLGDVFFPYAVLGVTHTKIKYSGPFNSYTNSGSDVSFGLGTDVHLNANTDLNIEYMSYYDKNDVSIDGFAVGVTYRF
ncbi:porin family protein [Oceanisphaera avium]|uniref:Outer membrane protein beta-barrel domain-containing protein n=1 Tax=Oceanisphaera avium TaxID=1903694 RepID=A0A1Y0D093_9GAMM|nr:porin family protein [Oceanisphaera avium]ART81002.1 hypothetical protein CBP12_13250 [Oceanisphaera avium]